MPYNNTVTQWRKIAVDLDQCSCSSEIFIESIILLHNTYNYIYIHFLDVFTTITCMHE